MKCLCSGEQIKTEYDVVRSSNSINSSQNGEGENNKLDTGNIEEAESSLREGGCLNYEVGILFLACSLLFANL